MPLNNANAELKGKLLKESEDRRNGQEGNTGIKLASCPMIPLCRYFYPVCLLRADKKRCWFPYLWSRMPRYQTGELQGLSLSNGVDSLRVPLLLNITGMSWVYNADSRRGCGDKKKKRTRCLSIQVISEGMSSLAQQMVYWLRSCLTENKHCCHISNTYNRPEVFVKEEEEFRFILLL